jgi:arylsulfatase A-like enzyme
MRRSRTGAVSWPPLLALALMLAGLASVERPADARHRLAALLPVEARETVHCAVDGDSRESVRLAPGREIALSVRAPARALLRFALAAGEAGSAPASWHLTIEDGARGIVAEDRTVASYAWVERARDHGHLAGRRLTLRARTAGASLCWANPTLAPRGRRGPLAIVVLLDTVRADHLSLHGYARPTSPGLEALARDGVVFEDAASDASWTRASVATLLTGRPALAHGVLARDAHLGTSWTTLAERFRAAGAHTVALSTNPNVLPYWGFARGFDRFVDVGAAEWTQNSDAARVLAVAREVVAATDPEPTLLYVHVNDAHAPYDPPAAAAVALLGRWDPASPGRLLRPPVTPAEVAGAVDRYDAEIHYLDARLADFLDFLRARGRYDRSLIVVVGDHGEEFLEHGGVYHGHTLFREQLHVPLIMKLPAGAGAGTRVAAPAEMIDVAPTMLALLGLPSGDLPGRILVDRAGRTRPGASLPRLAVTDLDHATVYAVEDEAAVLIVQTRPAERRWLFDRVADAEQRRDLAAVDGATRARLERLLDAVLLPGRAGWHVRLCGGPHTSALRVAIASPSPLERVERIDLEAADALEIAPGGAGLTLAATLAPRERVEERFGRLVARREPDRDELVFAGAGPLTITLDDARVPVRAGTDPQALPPGPAHVSLERAAAPAYHAPACPGRRSVFVWHVGTPRAERAIDPAIAERLRALGYLH